MGGTWLKKNCCCFFLFFFCFYFFLQTIRRGIHRWHHDIALRQCPYSSTREPRFILYVVFSAVWIFVFDLLLCFCVSLVAKRNDIYHVALILLLHPVPVMDDPAITLLCHFKISRDPICFVYFCLFVFIVFNCFYFLVI